MSAHSKFFNNSASENPLINQPDLPYGAPAFDQIKTEHLEPAVDWALEKIKQEIESIKNNPDAPSFENTIEALEHTGEDFDRINAVFETLSSNNTNEKIQEIEDALNEKTTPVFSDLDTDEILFLRIKEVYESKDKLNLNNEQIKLLENMYEERARNGATLNQEYKQQLKTINTKLAKLTTQYKQNMIGYVDAYEKIVTEDDLIGVPKRVLEVYKSAAKDAASDPDISQERKDLLQDKYLITLQPQPLEILSHCDNRSLRKEIHEALARIGCEEPFNNKPIVLDILNLRHQKAQILGYDHHADFVLSARMAKSSEKVMKFLESNLNAYKPSAEAYFNLVRSYALANSKELDFQPYDFKYYERQLKEKTFSFDSESLRPYFEINRVIEGFQNHIEKLFNIEMVDCSDIYPAYRDDAKVYEVKNKDDGNIIALFYTDYYADSATKRGGAWMRPFRDRAIDRHGVDQIPIVTNSCNFQKPSQDSPTLLSIREVTTLFHEGGHALHAILAEGKYGSLNGANVKWDFVELPSQLQENWIGQKEVLDTFARHYETDEPIPDEYIKTINEIKNFDAGYFGLRQTSVAMMDMLWHTSISQNIESMEAIEDEAHRQTSFWPERTESMLGRFGHLFGYVTGYSAGYYSYKWAEVLEADIFEEFNKKGLYHPETAQRLRAEIYSQGSKRDEMLSFEAMMGRKPDPRALFRREGIIDYNETITPKVSQPPEQPGL